MSEKINVLFVCMGNSCRSQMAEGWARQLKRDQLRAFSAGILPSRLDPLAVEVMAEAGVDISHQQTHQVTEFLTQDLDYVITVCDAASSQCPTFPGTVKHIALAFDDPPALTRNLPQDARLAVYRRVRDEIRAFIETLPEALTRATTTCCPPQPTA